MRHLVVETCLFQRRFGVRELPEEYPHTYAGLCRYSRVYGSLKEISGDNLWLKRV